MYHHLIEGDSSFVEFVVAYVLSIGFQFAHKCHCSGQFRGIRFHRPTRKSSYSQIIDFKCFS